MLRRLRNLLAVAVIAIAPVATLLAPAVAHAATYPCTWTGAVDNNFSTAGNWTGCNGAAPDPVNDTDDLVFPVTATNLTPVNDLTSATFNSITFNGTGSGGYDITGNAFTLAGDITDTSGETNLIENDVVVTGTSAVDVTDPALLDFGGNVSGSGSLTFSGDGPVAFENLTLTGSLTINSGVVQVFATSSADATVSGVTVASGAGFGYDAFGYASPAATYTLSTPINSAGGTFDFETLGGAGPFTLNLTGTITLTGNTQVVVTDGTVAHVQGSLHGAGFKLTTANSGQVLNESTDNTSATPAGDINPAAVAPTAATPSAPDTGFALVSANPAVSMAITVLAAGSILAIARLSRKALSRR
jgi:hypothetical protein